MTEVQTKLNNGFMPLPNNLCEALYSSRLSGTEYAVILFVYRQTVGFQNDDRLLTASYISVGTGIPCNTVQKALAKLIDKNILLASSPKAHTKRKLCVNQRVSEWLVENGVPKTVNLFVPTMFAENDQPSLPFYTNNKIQENKNNIINTGDRDILSLSPDDIAPVTNYQKIIDLFNSICGNSLPKVKQLTEQRRKLIRQANKYLQGDFDKLFRAVEDSDFLTGRNGKWTACNFDWILKPNNIVKILEGNYSNRTSTSKIAQRDYDEEF